MKITESEKIVERLKRVNDNIHEAMDNAIEQSVEEILDEAYSTLPEMSFRYHLGD